MCDISQAPQRLDDMSEAIGRALNQMNRLVQSLERFHQALASVPTRSLVPAHTVSDQQRVINNTQQIIHLTQVVGHNYHVINNTLRLTNTQINQNLQQQQIFNNQVREGQRASNGLMASLSRIGSAFRGMFDVRGGIRAIDDFTNSTARLNLIQDGSRSTAELQDAVFAAAERSRGSYATMANTVGKLGLLAGDVFANPDEMIAFAELMQKSLRVGGASPMEQQAGMHQITQAMAAGQIQGTEFKRIVENAPMLAKAISDFTGKSFAELSDGNVTIPAEVFKKAMFAAADEIQAKFGQVPVTFADIFTIAGDRALQAFRPLMTEISQSMQTESFAQLLNGLTVGLQMLGNVASWTFSLLLNHLDLVRNFLIALGVTALAFGVQWLIAWVIASWPVLAVIAGIMLLLWALDRMGVTADQIVGFVAGLFMGLYATVYNVVARIYNGFAAFAEFFANVFDHPVYSAKKLFASFVNSTLDMIKRVAEAIDWVFGSDLAGNITALQERITDWVGEMPEGYRVIERMEEKSIVEEAKKGYNAGAQFANGISDAMKDFNMDYSFGEGSFTTPNIGKVGEVGMIRDTVDISSEDLKTLRELAEMKNIQNFVTLTPRFSFGDTHIRQDGRSVDEIIANISDKMNEAIASGALGVYA